MPFVSYADVCIGYPRKAKVYIIPWELEGVNFRFKDLSDHPSGSNQTKGLYDAWIYNLGEIWCGSSWFEPNL